LSVNLTVANSGNGPFGPEIIVPPALQVVSPAGRAEAGDRQTGSMIAEKSPKRLPPKAVSEIEALDRFRREARQRAEELELPIGPTIVHDGRQPLGIELGIEPFP
jgi:hypothetical protein